MVASNVGGLSENIDSFVNGIKVEPEPDSLAWGISSMIQRAVERGDVRATGRGKAGPDVSSGIRLLSRMAGIYAKAFS